MSAEQKERNDRLSNVRDPITAPKPGGGKEGDPTGNFGPRAVPVEEVVTRESSDPPGPVTGGAFGHDTEDVVAAVVEGRKPDPSPGPAPVPMPAAKPGVGQTVSTSPAKPNLGVAPGEPVCW